MDLKAGDGAHVLLTDTRRDAGIRDGSEGLCQPGSAAAPRWIRHLPMPVLRTKRPGAYLRRNMHRFTL